MRNKKCAAVVVMFLGTVSCRPPGQVDAEREKRDRDSAAYRAGQSAHKIANEAERAADEAARKLKEGAQKAREGWKDQGKAEPDKRRDNER
jgi:hypothetical protein